MAISARDALSVHEKTIGRVEFLERRNVELLEKLRQKEKTIRQFMGCRVDEKFVKEITEENERLKKKFCVDGGLLASTVEELRIAKIDLAQVQNFIEKLNLRNNELLVKTTEELQDTKRELKEEREYVKVLQSVRKELAFRYEFFKKNCGDDFRVKYDEVAGRLEKVLIQVDALKVRLSNCGFYAKQIFGVTGSDTGRMRDNIIAEAEPTQ